MSQYENEVVIWKKNYFRQTMDIYEPRGPKYQCTQCSEIFNTRLSIFTHSKIHSKPFCVVCGLYTQNLQEMQNHMKNIHRELVEIISITKKDENQNIATCQVEVIEKDVKLPTKKPKAPSSAALPKISFGYNGQTKSDKHLVSRFGRCINVKIPADF